MHIIVMFFSPLYCLSSSRLAACVIQRYWRGWIHQKRQMVHIRQRLQIEREVGKSFDEIFAVVLRNVNFVAASRDDQLRKARQKQQRKAYLINVLRTATLTGGLRQIIADESARASAPEGATEKPEGVLPSIMRAAIQIQLLQSKRTAEARAAVASNNKSSEVSSNPGQLLFEVLSQVGGVNLCL